MWKSARQRNSFTVGRIRIVNIWRGGCLFALWLAAGLDATYAQLPQPKLDWLFPPGGQRGTKVEISVGGADLDDGRLILFSHAGLTARPQRTATDEFYPEGQLVPQRFTLEIASDVPPGFYEAQLVGRHGASTARLVHITDDAEVLDSGSNHTIDQAQATAPGSIVSGRTDAENIDYYAVELAPGDVLVGEIWAQRIDSQADVWLEVCRADGSPLHVELRTQRRDPIVEFTAAEAGQYFVRVQDVTFRGGEAFFYRLGLTKRSAESSAAPASDADLRVAAHPREVDGAPLASAVSERQPNDTPAEAQPLEVAGEVIGQFFPAADVDWFEFRVGEATELVVEAVSQRAGLPTDPLLTVSRVVPDAAATVKLEQVAEADDGESRPSIPGCNAATDDPYLRLKAEKDIIYRVMIRDQNSISRADPANLYRLIVRRPQPGFRLLAAPASPWSANAAIPLRAPLALRAGGTLAIPVVAVRTDGFVGDIVLAAEELPAGVSSESVTIRSGKTDAMLVLSADATVTDWAGPIRIVGQAGTGDQQLRQEAVPASLVWDSTVAKFERSRLNQQLTIAVMKEPAPVSVHWESAKWDCAPGSTFKAKLAVTAPAELKETFSLAPVNLPDGVTAKFTLAGDQKSAELELTVGEKVAPGEYDVILTGKPKVMYRNNPEAAVSATEDQTRITKLVDTLKSARAQAAATAGATADASAPEVKQLDERIGRGEAALKEATERAAKLAAAAQPAERLSYVVSNVGTLRVVAKAEK